MWKSTTVKLFSPFYFDVHSLMFEIRRCTKMVVMSGSVLLVVFLVITCFWRIRPVSQVIQVIPFWRCLTVHIVGPVTNSEFLVEAGLISTHVGYSPTILIAHVENLTIKIEVRVESYRPSLAVKCEAHIWKFCPPFFLK